MDIIEAVILEIASIEVRQKKILNVLRENNLIRWNGIVTLKEMIPVAEKIRERLRKNIMEDFPPCE